MEVHAFPDAKEVVIQHVPEDAVADVVVTVVAIVLEHVKDVVVTVVLVVAPAELYLCLINGKNKGKKTRVA